MALQLQDTKRGKIRGVTIAGVESEHHQWRYYFRSGKRVSSVTLQLQEWKESIIRTLQI